MHLTTRRTFLKTSATVGGAFSALSLSGSIGPARAKTGARVVVVGGGFGGATAARYLKWFDPSISVTLIEPKKSFTTCPFSNLVLAGLRSVNSITHDYRGQRALGVDVVHDTVTDIDAETREVMTQGGARIAYDRLILSPGIDFRFDEIDGYDETVAQTLPHAWKAGQQTDILRRQIEAMDDGGAVIIAPPGNPYRCPPGPYERASMIAFYLKTAKPKSKILILDAKEKFSKQGLFEAGWAQYYPGLIERVPLTEDGRVIAVDAKAMTVSTEFETHKGAVINVIPPQMAGQIAVRVGLTDKSGWCPIDFDSFESLQRPNIHVIGDAAIAPKMPKSGNAANTQAKVCAAAVVDLLNEKTPGAPALSNTCYSFITDTHAVSVTAVYRKSDAGFTPVKNSGGLSRRGSNPKLRTEEATNALGWYANIVEDIWG